MMALANKPFKISATVFLCSSTEFKLNITTPKLSHVTRAIGAPLGKGAGVFQKEPLPPKNFFTANFFLLLTIIKKTEEFKVLETEIQYP